MSRDLQFDATCDHQVIREKVLIKTDWKTIPIPRPLSTQKIELWINGYKTDSSDMVNGWQVTLDETYTYSIRSKILFNYKRKSIDDFYEITYYVDSKSCPKCFGLKTIFDESYSRLGSVNMVENEDKLLQEIKKGLSTHLGSNPFFEWIGTEIHKLVGGKGNNLGFLRSKIVQEVSSFLERYMDIQSQQAQFQDVTDKETFYSLLKVDAGPISTTDPTIWKIEVIFSNQTGDTSLYEKTIKIP